MKKDDPLDIFTRKSHGRQPTASAIPPTGQRVPESDGEEGYDAFSNQVRPVCVELRCHRSGLSYSIPYAHLGAIVFNFRTGRELSFTGAGFGVTIRGSDLTGVARALKLHSCSLIEDYSAGHGPMPDTAEGAAFVESIEVRPLGPVPQREKEKKRETETA